MNYKLLLLFVVAFLFRVLLIPVAHHGDLNNNISWGEELLVRGIDGFYGSSDANEWPYSAPNQPPLYLLLFGSIVWIYQQIDILVRALNESIGIFPSSFVWYWEESGMDLMAKLPGILSDLGIGGLIYYYTFQKGYSSKLKNEGVQEKKNKSIISLRHNKALLIVGIWLFNPLTWYNASIWGQTDPIVNFLGLIGVLGLMGVFGSLKWIGKLEWFAFWFVFAFLFKPSLAIYIPILFIYILKQKYSITIYLRSLVIALTLTVVSSIWFHPHPDFPLWFFDLYTNRILPGEIGYLTANAFNFWWLVDSGKTLDSTMYFGLSARMWGILVTLSSFFALIYWYIKGKTSIVRTFFALSLSSFVAYIFMTRIHERYLYPFFPYATMILISIPKMWIGYVVISIIHLLNLYHLFWAPSIPLLESLYANPWFAYGLSIMSLIVLLCYAYRGIKENGV